MFKVRLGFPVFLLFILLFSGFSWSQGTPQGLNCKIADSELFVASMNAIGIRNVKFEITGFTSQAAVHAFEIATSGVDRVISVRCRRANKSGTSKVEARFAENASLNDFRMMLLAGGVKQIITPQSTYEVLYLQVKLSNPFQ